MPQQSSDGRNLKTLIAMLTIAIVMIGLAYASVPLYRLFCQITGFGGTPLLATSLPDRILDREMKVSFNTDVDAALGWDFSPEVREMTVNIGAKGLVNYSAKNVSSQPIAGTAVYNVSPLKVGKYFHKIQCFCFAEQLLMPNQDMQMPVVFYIDPSIAEDPLMDDVTDVTLSYTFYQSESATLDAAMEVFYDRQ